MHLLQGVLFYALNVHIVVPWQNNIRECGSVHLDTESVVASILLYCMHGKKCMLELNMYLISSIILCTVHHWLVQWGFCN